MDYPDGFAPGTIGRSSDLQAKRSQSSLVLLAAASQPYGGQCLMCGFRSCLPLRGSSGFEPDSLSSTTQISVVPTVLCPIAKEPVRARGTDKEPSRAGVLGRKGIGRERD